MLAVTQSLRCSCSRSSDQRDRAEKMADLIIPSDPDTYFGMTEVEARRLILAPGLPLFGDIDPERYFLLDPLEAMIQRDICEMSELAHPTDVWDFIDGLVNAFYRVDVRPVLTRATAEHAQTVSKRLRSLIQALDDPSTK